MKIMAKLIIKKVINRIELVKFFREEKSKISISEAVYYVNSLPYTFDDVSTFYAEEMKKRLYSIAEVSIEEEEDHIYNININPPEEAIKAIQWHETLSEEEKSHIAALFSWWNRPAVC